jgi:hypothetical protein
MPLSITVRQVTRAAIVLAAGLVAIQFIPVDRTNPPVSGEIPASVAVNSILRRACYDCHSNETVWPWYSRVAPISFLVARDVHQGRRHVNFSTWQQYPPAKQAKTVKEIGEQVAKGEMPMAIYLPLHQHARLSDRDKAVIAAWVKETAEASLLLPSAAAPAPAPH